MVSLNCCLWYSVHHSQEGDKDNCKSFISPSQVLANMFRGLHLVDTLFYKSLYNFVITLWLSTRSVAQTLFHVPLTTQLYSDRKRHNWCLREDMGRTGRLNRIGACPFLAGLPVPVRPLDQIGHLQSMESSSFDNSVIILHVHESRNAVGVSDLHSHVLLKGVLVNRSLQNSIEERRATKKRTRIQNAIPCRTGKWNPTKCLVYMDLNMT